MKTHPAFGEADLTNCERELIHLAGSVQPHGVLLVLGADGVVQQASTNTAAVLTWQTCIARLLAAKDSKTGRKVYTGTAFFFVCRWVIPGLWGIAALAMIEPSCGGGWVGVLRPRKEDAPKSSRSVMVIVADAGEPSAAPSLGAKSVRLRVSSPS